MSPSPCHAKHMSSSGLHGLHRQRLVLPWDVTSPTSQQGLVLVNQGKTIRCLFKSWSPELNMRMRLGQVRGGAKGARQWAAEKGEMGGKVGGGREGGGGRGVKRPTCSWREAVSRASKSLSPSSPRRSSRPCLHTAGTGFSAYQRAATQICSQGSARHALDILDRICGVLASELARTRAHARGGCLRHSA